MIYKISAVSREEKRGEKVRKEGKIPAIVYGVGGKSISLSLEKTEFLKIFSLTGEASLIDLSVDGADGGKVLVQDIQRDPVTDRIIHVDLRRIDMDKPLTAMVALRFINEAPVIKEKGGILVHNVEQVEVKCLPKDLVSHIEIDLSALKAYSDIIRVENLKLPAGVEVLNPRAGIILVKAVPALSEEEIKKMEEQNKEADVSKIETAGKKKEEETVEGEAEGVKEKKEEEKK
ncbi:MAG: 50S ribosomal protein L25 [Patescibacteria group bacterium]